MATLIPKATTCYPLTLPSTEKDDRLNLNVRTGSASTLSNSLIFVFGGLTIGLELFDRTITELHETFMLKVLNSNTKIKHISRYLSGEFFYLNILERNWVRVDLPPDAIRPKPRLFHELCAFNNCVYVFGGLVIPETDNERTNSLKNFLVPVNDLWEFNLESSTWRCLHEGTNYEEDTAVPIPRYDLKMTFLSSLSFVGKKEHFGIIIAGGKDKNSQPIYDNVVFDVVDQKYVGEGFGLKVTSGTPKEDEEMGFNSLLRSEDKNINVDAANSIIITFLEEKKHLHRHPKQQNSSEPATNTSVSPNQFLPARGGRARNGNSTRKEELIIVYTPTLNESKMRVESPLISFKLGKSVRNGKLLPIHRKKNACLKTNVDGLEQKVIAHTIPFNLRYPTGGIFGQNVVITGFLPNEYDISIFIYNKPTGKWSRLNIFCNHDYGSHRFWGGYVWQSHHRIILLGNFLTSRTTSSIRFFTVMLTVSLPVTNILASSELAGGHHHGPDGRRIYHGKHPLHPKHEPLHSSSGLSGATDDSSTDQSTCSSILMEKNGEAENQDKKTVAELQLDVERSHSTSSDHVSPTSISFSEYVHYAAPKINFTNIRSVFPPAAITLGRNAFDRYGDLISDFEIISLNGDRIPISMAVLMERWGKYFIELLARAYVQAVDKFEADQNSDSNGWSTKGGLRSSSKSSSVSKNKLSIGDLYGKSDYMKKSEYNDGANADYNAKQNKSNSMYISLRNPHSKHATSEVPQFRLPFQDVVQPEKEVVATSATTTEDGDHRFKIMVNSTSQSPEETSSLATTPGEEIPVNTSSPHSSTGSPSRVATTPEVAPRKNSTSSFASNNSLLTSHLHDIPPQLPLPNEQIPAVPATPISFRQSSLRKNSSDFGSPRASLIQTLSQLRNIGTTRSPRESPFNSPRASLSGASGPTIGSGQGEHLSNIPNLRATRSGSVLGLTKSDSEEKVQTPAGEKKPSFPKWSSFNSMNSDDSPLYKKQSFSSSDDFDDDSSARAGSMTDYNDSEESCPQEPHLQTNRGGIFENALLNFDNLSSGKINMEPLLIPRKLYMPFLSITLKAFCEYLYTGQVGNKWLLFPTTLDNLGIAKFCKVPLLYDLISEVLFGIIGRKEAHIIKEGNKLKNKFNKLLEQTGKQKEPRWKFPLDEYDGFMDTVDDGFLDVALLKRLSNMHKNSSVFSARKKKSLSSFNEEGETPDEAARAAESPKESDPEKLAESTDHSSDKKSEDESDFGLGFLDLRNESVIQTDFRSKSIFDRSHTLHEDFGNAMEDEEDEKSRMLNLLLEELVSPEFPPPCDNVIDQIYETAAIVVDMKLMLRALNVRQMSRFLVQTRIDIGHAITELEKTLEEQSSQKEKLTKQQQGHHQQQRATNLLTIPTNKVSLLPSGHTNQGSESGSLTPKLTSGLSRSSSYFREGSGAPHSPSAVSPTDQTHQEKHPGERLKSTGLTNSVNSGKGSTSSTLEKSRTNSGLRNLSGLTPFKLKALSQKLSNKELDKRITKMIKQDEKERMHFEKMEKREKKKSTGSATSANTTTKNSAVGSPASGSIFNGIGGNDMPSLLRNSSRANLLGDGNVTGSSSKKFGLFGKKKDHSPRKDSDGSEGSTLKRTQSPTGSLQSSASRTSKLEKRKHGFFGLKR